MSPIERALLSRACIYFNRALILSPLRAPKFFIKLSLSVPERVTAVSAALKQTVYVSGSGPTIHLAVSVGNLRATSFHAGSRVPRTSVYPVTLPARFTHFALCRGTRRCINIRKLILFHTERGQSRLYNRPDSFTPTLCLAFALHCRSNETSVKQISLSKKKKITFNKRSPLRQTTEVFISHFFYL